MTPRPVRPRLLACVLLQIAAALLFADAGQRLDGATTWQQASQAFALQQERMLETLAATGERHTRLLADYRQERLFLHQQELPEPPAPPQRPPSGQWLTIAASETSPPSSLTPGQRSTATWHRLELEIRIAQAGDLLTHLGDWLQGTAARPEHCRVVADAEALIAHCLLLWPRWQAH
ncbi:hypothetical protein VX159_03420 [Dechloromonas sp. ZY10]|uniref:hypothetical protein n=1 Tax=Dechloromonas aquae TaxID=2664436 RepID=UPI003526EA3C